MFLLKMEYLIILLIIRLIKKKKEIFEQIVMYFKYLKIYNIKGGKNKIFIIEISKIVKFCFVV